MFIINVLKLFSFLVIYFIFIVVVWPCSYHEHGFAAGKIINNASFENILMSKVK